MDEEAYVATFATSKAIEYKDEHAKAVKQVLYVTAPNANGAGKTATVVKSLLSGTH